MERHGIPYNPDFVIIDDYMKLKETEGTYLLAKKYFSDHEVPTAFVTISDVFAFGLIKALKELGFRVPEDVSVIGFLDNRVGRYFEPALTTVVQPMDKMGNTSMNLLLDLVEKKEPAERRIVFQAELLKRNTVAAVRTADKPIIGAGKSTAKENVHEHIT